MKENWQTTQHLLGKHRHWHSHIEKWWWQQKVVWFVTDADDDQLTNDLHDHDYDEKKYSYTEQSNQNWRIFFRTTTVSRVKILDSSWCRWNSFQGKTPTSSSQQVGYFGISILWLGFYGSFEVAGKYETPYSRKSHISSVHPWYHLSHSFSHRYLGYITGNFSNSLSRDDIEENMFLFLREREWKMNIRIRRSCVIDEKSRLLIFLWRVNALYNGYLVLGMCDEGKIYFEHFD